MAHVRDFGLHDLVGRNKSSDNVPTDDPNWTAKVKYAQEHNLWHYHIGIHTMKSLIMAIRSANTFCTILGVMTSLR